MSKTILFVDDDIDDRDLMAEIVQKINPSVNAVFAQNGLEAIEYLNTKKEMAQLPCLIVLDLNMPFLDGKETYKKIKEELQLQAVPVIIFTSSLNPNDKVLFTNLGVEFYTKPDDFGYYNTLISRMVNVCNGEN